MRLDLDRFKEVIKGLRCWFLPMAGLIMLTLVSIIYLGDRGLYFLIMTRWIISPFHTPFIDAQSLPDVIDCWKRGIDVYIAVPCDPLQRPWIYSPMWLWASFVPAWANWMGLALDSAFYISLALLPQPRRPAAYVLMGLAIFSSMCVFALERGNMDLVMFMLILAGGWFWSRNLPARLIGYAIFLFAGLLKFYPLVLCLLFIRERILWFLALCVIAGTVLTGFLWLFQAELREVARNLPVFSYFSYAFGSRQLPAGLQITLPYLLKTAGISNKLVLEFPAQTIFSADVWLALISAVLIFALRFAKQRDIQIALAALTAGERDFLLTGAALICGCFFSGESNAYRGVFLLFVLPGLLALSGVPGASRMFAATVGGIIFLMWGMSIQTLVAYLSGGGNSPMSGSAAIYVYWIIRELIWWWVIAVFLGVLLSFIGGSPPWRLLRQAIGKTRAAII